MRGALKDNAATEAMPTIDDIDDLVELVAMVARAEPAAESRNLYLRYSEGPVVDAQQGPSVDYEAGVRLPGWAVTTIKPEWWWDRPARDWVARRVCKYGDLGSVDGHTRPWLLSGSIVGTGPDHEPLVTDVTPIAWIGPRLLEQAHEIYHERFDVGRDSS